MTHHVFAGHSVRYRFLDVYSLCKTDDISKFYAALTFTRSVRQQEGFLIPSHLAPNCSASA